MYKTLAIFHFAFGAAISNLWYWGILNRHINNASKIAIVILLLCVISAAYVAIGRCCYKLDYDKASILIIALNILAFAVHGAYFDIKGDVGPVVFFVSFYGAWRVLQIAVEYILMYGAWHEVGIYTYEQVIIVITLLIPVVCTRYGIYLGRKKHISKD